MTLWRSVNIGFSFSEMVVGYWVTHFSVELGNTTALERVRGQHFFNVLFNLLFCFLFSFRSWGLNEAEVCLLFDGTTQVELASNNFINKVKIQSLCFINPEIGSKFQLLNNFNGTYLRRKRKILQN